MCDRESIINLSGFSSHCAKKTVDGEPHCSPHAAATNKMIQLRFKEYAEYPTEGSSIAYPPKKKLVFKFTIISHKKDPTFYTYEIYYRSLNQQHMFCPPR